RHEQSATGRRVTLEAIAVAVEMFEPRPSVGQADAFVKRVVGKADAVVADFEPQIAALAARDDVDAAAADLRPDAMAQRVFHEWLQYEIRHRGIERVELDLDVDLQPIAEACLFNLEILAQEIELVLQR